MTVGTVIDKIKSMENIVANAKKIEHDGDIITYEIVSGDFYRMCAMFDQYKAILCKMEVDEEE